MGQQNSKDYETNLKWSNWNDFIVSSSKQMDFLGELSSKCYYNKKLINLYFSKLKSYMVTRKSLIADFEDIKKDLIKIGEILFSKAYLNDLNNNPNSHKIQYMQHKIIEKLDFNLGKIQESLSESEVFPKVTINKKMLGAVRTN